MHTTLAARLYANIDRRTWYVRPVSFRSSSVRQAHINDATQVWTHAILCLTFGRSSRASVYQLIRGIWYIATKAGKAHFRYESRVGGCVVYDTALEGLRSIAVAQGKLIQAISGPESKENALDASDNVQAWKTVYEQRLGRESRMLTGFAGTLVIMKNYEEGAFDAQPFWANVNRMDRKQLTVPLLEDAIDTDHLENVSWTIFAEVLIDYVPTLQELREDFTKRETTLLQQNQIPLRQSEIVPLATNDANEMTPQGMVEGLQDHITTQRGFTDENWHGRLLLHHGDGKTFEGYLRIQKYMAGEPGNISSFRALVPMPETWHTMWTDLSRIVRASAGEGAPDTDPSTLKAFAAEAGCKMPNDLRKVDFYEGEHLVMLALRAHVLVIWEYVIHLLHTAWFMAMYLRASRTEFGTEDLVKYFAEKAKNGDLPSVALVEEKARKLAARHATTKARVRALNPVTEDENLPPRASHWHERRANLERLRADRAHPADNVHQPDSDSDTDTDSASAKLSDLSDEQPHPDRDVVLANTDTLIRNVCWWYEFYRAVKRGDTGRLLKILTVSTKSNSLDGEVTVLTSRVSVGLDLHICW